MEVWRGGVTTNRVKKENETAVVSAGGAHNSDTRPGFYFAFSLPSKGGGSTWTKLWVPPEDFKEIAWEMIRGAPEDARIAFLAALLDQADPKGRRRRRSA